MGTKCEGGILLNSLMKIVLIMLTMKELPPCCERNLPEYVLWPGRALVSHWILWTLPGSSQKSITSSLLQIHMFSLIFLVTQIRLSNIILLKTPRNKSKRLLCLLPTGWKGTSHITTHWYTQGYHVPNLNKKNATVFAFCFLL